MHNVEFNRPQVISMLQQAKWEAEWRKLDQQKRNQQRWRKINVSGRATGKSTDRAHRFRKIVQTMPRSTNILAGRSFKQMLENTLSPLVDGLERLGYVRDRDFLIGKKPPAKWKWPRPYQAPESYDHFMPFSNGTGWHLFSQDAKSYHRGHNIDSWDGDEGFLLDKKKLEDDVSAANRGNKQYFGNNPLHHSFDISSSMPPTAQGMWVLEYGKYYDEDGSENWALWNRIVKLQLVFLESKNQEEKKSLMLQWKDLIRKIKFYHKDGTFFMFSNVFDNLQNVEMSYIMEQKAFMTPMSFRIEMLNERISSVDNCFYKIRDDVHVYDAVNMAAVEAADYDFAKLKTPTCRYDSDVDLTRPLELGIDFGGNINAMRVCQEHFTDLYGKPEWQFRYVKDFFVQDPYGLKDLVSDFCNYYSIAKCKRVVLWYDQTAIGKDGARMPLIYECKKYFESFGWKVDLRYIGAAPEHHMKYLLWEVVCKEEDNRYPKVRFNRTNAKEGLLSMYLAGAKPGRKGVDKDKSTERSKTIPRIQATDLSDAGDLPLWGKYSAKLESIKSFYSIV